MRLFLYIPRIVLATRLDGTVWMIGQKHPLEIIHILSNSDLFMSPSVTAGKAECPRQYIERSDGDGVASHRDGTGWYN